MKSSGDVLSLSEEDCLCLNTEYKFKVKNFLYGSDDDEIITVNSQVGDIFKVGKEYTFTADRINNTLYDVYTVNSRRWVIDNESADVNVLSALSDEIACIPVQHSADVVEVPEYASYSDDFINDSVDVAAVATITSADYDYECDVYDITVSDVDFLKGTASEEAVNNVRIRGDIHIGDRYLMMFEKDEDDTLMMASRYGSVIKVDDPSAMQYETVLVNS